MLLLLKSMNCFPLKQEGLHKAKKSGRGEMISALSQL